MSAELSSSCVTASNTISAMSVVSLTTKSVPAWPPAGPIFSIWKRGLKRVQGIRATPDFEPIAASFKRIKNILKQATSPIATFQPNCSNRARSMSFHHDPRDTRPTARIRASARLRPKVDLFFDKVLVNADDPSIRRNRLALLHNLLQEFSDVADFSEIVTERQS